MASRFLWTISVPLQLAELLHASSGSRWNINLFFYNFREDEGIASDFQDLPRSLQLQILESDHSMESGSVSLGPSLTFLNRVGLE